MARSIANYTKAMDEYRNADAMSAVIELAKQCNKYIDQTAPWALAKDEAQHDRLKEVLYHLAEGIRILALLFAPVMPSTSKAMMEQLGTTLADTFDGCAYDATRTYQTGTATPLFARIDAEKMLEEIAASQPKVEEPAEEEKQNVVFLDQIGIDDFMKVDLRVAKIVDCEPIKKAKKLLKLTLDDGSGTPRTVCSGIALWYTPDELKGKSVILVANLKPAVLCGVESQGMLLAADVGDAAKVIFVDGVEPGSRVR